MATPSIAQADLNFSIDAPDWVALKILLRKIDQEIAQRRRSLLYQVSLWLCAVDTFRDFEQERLLINKPSPRDQEYHRAILANLIGNGEMLMLDVLKHTDVDTKNIGIETRDMRAMVDELQANQIEWYGDMTQPRKTEILKEVFGVEARPT